MNAMKKNIFSISSLLSFVAFAALLTGCADYFDTSSPAGEKPAAVTPAAPVEPAPAPVASEDDGAIIAAITAAITAMRAEDGASGSFRVVSFKRVGKSAARR
jgi:hypothetical protein